MMKKATNATKKTTQGKIKKSIDVNNPQATYKSIRLVPQVKDFNYAEFKKIADKTPFTLSEWSSILHLSERTLQRYAKNNSNFAAINAERALQIEKVIKEGKLAFGNTQNFYEWLKRNPSMLEGQLSMDSLYSLDGIEKILSQLGRIQQGLFA